jgi:hypothetical protein
MVTVSYAPWLVGSLAFYFILHHFWGRYMLTSFSKLEGQGFALAGLGHVWFIFAWGAGVTLFALFALNQRRTSDDPRHIGVVKALWLSANAGVLEEIIFRALIFLNAMVILVFVNFISFGLVGWLYAHWFVPLANLVTFHALQPELMGHHSWVFGAAIVSASMEFRDAHKHLGFIGWVNAWFLGMVLFWLVFNYGLLTAIVAHFLYDAIIFVLRALTSEKESGFAGALKRLLYV